ncbi:MAG: glycosyltransferase family 4 protein [Alkalinema sp. RU_4_3]|nr:glycosyltransferase family 4 protein [Alkalinema sp. RU_4_3]
MNILYDGQVYGQQVAGGVGRYFANVISRLPETVFPMLMTQHQGNQLNYPTHPNLKHRQFFGFRPRRLSNRVQDYYFRWRNQGEHFDLMHPTYYHRLTQESFQEIKQPLVITVYDMIHEILSDTLDPVGYTMLAKYAAVQAADAILCISEHTKQDLIRYYPEAEAKATVTPLASELKGEWAYGEETVPIAPYVLYVGSRNRAYKNFDTLLLAFSKAVTIQPELSLCVVGPAFDRPELQQIADLKLGDRITLYRHPPDAHLAKLYRCSVALVYPSLYEGFGIPPLEAMNCGTAVIAANASSLPEVVGEAGILFDPMKPEDLTEAMLHLLEAPIERDRLIAKGHVQQAQFSWDKTAAATLQVYRSLL